MRDPAILPAPELRLARQQLLERGNLSRADIGEHVTQSWQRSLESGLTPLGRLDCVDNLSGAGLQRARNQNHELISHSEPVMEYLFEQVGASSSMVILSDAQGVLMHTLGDLNFLSRAERVALHCGASWAESQRGTNAIGTALAEGREIEIHGAEHYLDNNGFLTCAAAPIFSAQGRLMGILDLSSDHSSRHPHTLGLVSTAAQMIENSLALMTCRHQTVVLLHARPEGIGSVAYGMLAFSEDGWLVGANRKGLAMLGLQREDVGATTWPRLFEQSLDDTARARKGGRPILLKTHSGQALFARVHSPHLAPQRMRSPQSQAPTAPRDALTQLDTGDLAWRSAAGKARKVMDKSIPLLLTGERGVGKAWFARAVHQCASRRDRAFVTVRCAAVPEQQIEAELCGHVASAARPGVPGRLREAHGGTLLLEGVDALPLAAQTRLLRVLQDRQLTPLGGHTAMPLEFDLICTSSLDLRQAAEKGRFRRDLLERINGLCLHLPALRERTDFEALCGSILRQLVPDVELVIDPDLLQGMLRHDWPGNLRELEHVLRTAVALMDAHELQIGWVHMPDDLVMQWQQQGVAPAGDPST